MPSKLERFTAWRGEKAEEEAQYLQIADLIDSYVKSISSIQTIKANFSSKNSPVFKKISQFEHYIFSTLLFLKLEIEELLDSEENPPIEDPAFIERRQLLLNAREILGNLYSMPSINQLNSLNDLIHNAQILISKGRPDKQKEQNFCFALYTMLSIINLWFQQLSSLKVSFLSVSVNIPEIRQKILNLIKQTETKSLALDLFLQSVEQQPLEELLSNRFLKTVNKKLPSKLKLNRLTAQLSQLTSDVGLLIDVRERQNLIQIEIENVQILNQLVVENEKKLFEQDYFKEVIKGHSATFERVLEYASGPKKEQLLANMKQMQDANDSKTTYSNLAKGYAKAWSSAVCSRVPSVAQNLITKVIPYTLDSQSTAYFKDLAQIYMDHLTDQLQKLRTFGDGIVAQIAMDDAKIQRSLHLKSINDLKILKHESSAAYKSALGFTEVSTKIQKNILILDQCAAHHNGFWVKVSNFFARISSFFKSDRAKLIDTIRDAKNDLIAFEQSCLNELGTMANHNAEYDKYLELQYKFQHFCHTDPTYLRVHSALSVQEFIFILKNNIRRFEKPWLIPKQPRPAPMECKSNSIPEGQSAALHFFNPAPSLACTGVSLNLFNLVHAS